MKPERAERLMREGLLKSVSPDIAKARSLMISAEKTASYAAALQVTENSATVIFRELYESLRMLGEARLCLLGYSTDSHEAQLEALEDYCPAANMRLTYLNRFREIRHKANYYGNLVEPERAKEIIAFWTSHGKDFLEKLKTKVR